MSGTSLGIYTASFCLSSAGPFTFDLGFYSLCSARDISMLLLAYWEIMQRSEGLGYFPGGNFVDVVEVWVAQTLLG